MIYRYMSALVLLILLAGCSVPPQPTTIANRPPAAGDSPTLPSATPSLVPARPTFVPATATPTTTTPPTATAVTPMALATATAVTPSTPTVAASAVLTGTISYVTETLPDDAKLVVRLIGVPGLGINVLGQQEFAPVPAAPVAFALPYDPASVNPIEYPIIYIEAAIESSGIILFEHERVNVLTPDMPTTADITLTPSTRAVVSGTISYPTGAALPSDATLTVWLAKSPEELPYVQDEQIITPVPSGSMSFLVQSSITENTPDDTYQLYATLRGGGKLLFVTNQLLPVTLKDRRAIVDLTLESPARVGVVNGTVSYQSASELPADAVLTVELRDVSGADGPAPLMGEQRVTPVGPGPIPFTIEYDQALAGSTRVYAVSAQVYSGERLLFTSMNRYEVQLGDSTPNTIEMQPAIN